MIITSNLFAAYLQCPTKCFLRSRNETGIENAYAEWIRVQNESYRSEELKRITARVPSDECIISPPSIENLKAPKWQLAVNLVAAHAQKFESCIHAVEQIPSQGRGKSAQFIPIRFVFTNKLTRDDKLLLGFDAFVLSEVMGCEIGLGKIVHGDNHAALKVKTAALLKQVQKLTSQISTL